MIESEISPKNSIEKNPAQPAHPFASTDSFLCLVIEFRGILG